MGNEVAAARFLGSVAPLLAARSLTPLTGMLHECWPPGALVGFLSSSSAEVVRAAAACLGLTGSMTHCDLLAPLLGHSDARVAQSAEDSLWRIWMQAGSIRGNEQLAVAVACIGSEDYRVAELKLNELTTAEPIFAEAYHQRGIACYFLDRLDEAAACFRRALKLNRYHFAATAALGHIHTQRSDAYGALRHYRRAVQIHPGLNEIREVVGAIEAAIRRRRPAAG